AVVATSGSYNDLANKPSIPTLPATVSQAEAEAGAATTARLWTSQRVRQNVPAFTYDKATIDSKIDAGGGGGGDETYPYHGSLGASNLNDVREPGLWGQSVHAEATIGRNYPFEGVPGALEVLTLNPDTTPYAITTQR